jgi:hypothetical protein
MSIIADSIMFLRANKVAEPPAHRVRQAPWSIMCVHVDLNAHMFTGWLIGLIKI